MVLTDRPGLLFVQLPATTHAIRYGLTPQTTCSPPNRIRTSSARMGSCTHGSHPFFIYSLRKGGSPDVDYFGKRHPAGLPQIMAAL